MESGRDGGQYPDAAQSGDGRRPPRPRRDVERSGGRAHRRSAVLRRPHRSDHRGSREGAGRLHRAGPTGTGPSGTGLVIKLICLLKRRPGMTPEAFHDYWRNEHGPLIASTKSGSHVLRYEQNPRPLASYANDPDGYDGVTIQWFASEA